MQEFTIPQIRAVLNGDYTFTHLGFSMLITRFKRIYAEAPTSETLEHIQEEVNTFLKKYSSALKEDTAVITAINSHSEERRMLMTFEEAVALIESGKKCLHISGATKLVEKLPKGRWFGGSTEYFMSKDGGSISHEKLFVSEMPDGNHKVVTYDASSIHNIAKDSFENGFTILIIPFESPVHEVYAKKSAEFEDMFSRPIAGWISGYNLGKEGQYGQYAIAANGLLGEIYRDKAVAIHIEIPEHRQAIVDIINIFTADESSPVFEFTTEEYLVDTCLIDGKEMKLADYLDQNKVDLRFPFIGDYSGIGSNTSFKSVKDGIVELWVPTFKNIQYRLSKPVDDYVAEFNRHIDEMKDDVQVTFSCNCLFNFMFGELEGKKIKSFFGPITFGEIAYQIMNQTLVYLYVV